MVENVIFFSCSKSLLVIFVPVVECFIHAQWALDFSLVLKHDCPWLLCILASFLIPSTCMLLLILFMYWNPSVVYCTLFCIPTQTSCILVKCMYCNSHVIHCLHVTTVDVLLFSLIQRRERESMSEISKLKTQIKNFLHDLVISSAYLSP